MKIISRFYFEINKIIISTIKEKKNLTKIYSYFKYREGYYINKLKIIILKRLGAAIGSKVYIAPGVTIDFPEHLSIGSNVSIQKNCFISAYGTVSIGNDVSIAHNTTILSSTHNYSKPGIIRETELIKESVRIGNNVWIGCNVTILLGITIGNNTVIGAMSLVNKNIEENIVAAGVPVKKIKTLKCE